MQIEEFQPDCQIPCLQHIAQGIAEVPPESLGRRLKLMIRRRLSPTRERTLRRRSNDLMNWFCKLTGRSSRPSAPPASVSSTRLKAGDRVRVRSKEEIESTLNHWRQLRGCTFMPEMVQYCGTTHWVHKAMKRFVDERDLRVKRCNGIILLEGVWCQGTADFGSCDRSCFLFWREEWLEGIDRSNVA